MENTLYEQAIKLNKNVFDKDIRNEIVKLTLTDYTNCLPTEAKFEKLKELLDRLFPKSFNVYGENTVFLKKLILSSKTQCILKNCPFYLLAYAYKKAFKGISNGFDVIFHQVIESLNDLKIFCEIIRSSIFETKSFGGHLKNIITTKLNNLPDYQILEVDEPGKMPTKDIIILIHPKPNSDTRATIYGYALGKDVNLELIQDLSDKAKQILLNQKSMKLNYI